MIYEIVKNDFGNEILKHIDQDGVIWWIPIDLSNSMYQAYLNKDKPQVEHLTEMVPLPQ